MRIFDIGKKELKNNFKTYLRNNALVEPSDVTDVFMNMEVTHTFAESNDGKTLLLNEIFFNKDAGHRGLLSYGYRERHSLPNSRKPDADANIIGLNDFVFAYLGSHEAYYGGGDIEPSFGVFISKDLENEETSNASRRDLVSSDITKPVRGEFFTPEDVRKIISHEIKTKYKGDIWYYWGSPEYFNEENYMKTMWERKAEMHFYDKVSAMSIKGIIWPNKKYLMHKAINNMPNIDVKRDFADLYPNIKIYEYEWTSKYGQDAFYNASHYVSKYFFENSKYPESCKIEYEP